MSFRLKPLTTKSWLVISETDSDRIGLLTEIRDQYVLMAAGAKQQFLNRKEVNNYFNTDVFENVKTADTEIQSKKDCFINGYPVDFENPNEVFITGNKLPLFSKKTTSDVYYCAGYYCLKFPKNWMLAFSPKLSTLETYEYIGPFKNEIDAKASLSLKRKEKNDRIE